MHPRIRAAVAAHVWRVPSEILSSLPTPLRGIRVMRLYTESLEEHPKHFTRRMRNGLVFSGNTRDVIQRNVYTFGVWEPEITHWLSGFVRSGDLVIDVGANTGYFTLQAAKLVGAQGRVLAVEPVPSIRAEFEHNLEINACTNVTVYGIVASDAPGETTIYRASDRNVGNSSTVDEPGHVSEGKVAATPLDVALRDVDLSRLRVVKIDTEGDEARVLAGMTGVLSSMSPGSAVLVEVTPEKLALRGATEADVWRRLPLQDWAPHRINNDYLLESYLADAASPPVPIAAPLGERADLIFIKR